MNKKLIELLKLDYQIMRERMGLTYIKYIPYTAVVESSH